MPTLPIQWLRKKAMFGAAGFVVLLAVFTLFRASPWRHPMMAGDIPLPFGQEGALQGSLTKFGQRNGIDVYDVTFDHSEVSEHLTIDRIYLLHVSNTSSAMDVPLDLALTLSGTGGHLVDYYGYRYSDTVATLEKRDIKAFRFKDRFPGQFFMSQTARRNDSKNGNLLSTFETANQITFLRTDNVTGGVRLDPAGALYVIVVNEKGGADIAVRNIIGCGNAKLDLPEQCDDGNTNDADYCRNDCRMGLPIPLDAPLSSTGINLAIKQIAVPDAISSLQSRIPLVRFSAAASDPILLKQLVFRAQSGSLLRMHSYRMWQDTNNDGITDSAVSPAIEASGGLVRFSDALNWTGALVLSQTGTVFELKADAVPGPQFRLRIEFALEQADVLDAKRVAGTFPLLGIQRNGECKERKCSMALKTILSPLWTLGGNSLCGNGVQNDFEQCDDGNFVDGDKCTRFCQVETYSIRISGRLVDALSGKAISGANLRSAYAYSPSDVRTDSQGNFSLDVRTDFTFNDGTPQGEFDSQGAGWSIVGDCYQAFSFGLQKGQGMFMGLWKSPFDQEYSLTDIGTSQNVDLGTVSLYPSAHIRTKTDVQSTMEVNYRYKNILGFSGGGNGNLRLEHVLSGILPVGYDIHVRFTREDGTAFDSEKFTVPSDAMCKTVRLEHDSVTGESKWSTGEHLFVTSKSMQDTETVVRNQKDVTLQRFEAFAESDMVLTRVVVDAEQGSLLNAENYALWIDTDDNGIVDSILQSGALFDGNAVVFNNFLGGGVLIPDHRSVAFEVHADIAAVGLSEHMKLQLKFATSQSDYLAAERASDGAHITGIQTDGVCSGECNMIVVTVPSAIYTIRSQGDLFVTKDSTPVRSRQLLGGTLGDSILRLQFIAEYEPVSPVSLRFTASGSGVSSVDSLELYQIGDTEPVAIATQGHCGDYPAQFCTGSQKIFTVQKGSAHDLIIRPRMKSDVDGAVSGGDITLSLFAPDSVIAVGEFSSNTLLINDADASQEGRVYIGSDRPAVHHSITGNKNVVVLSKIVSITNVDPNADGTAVPSGTQRAIGQFKFETLAASNLKNGANKWTLTDILFDVDAINVDIDPDSFRLFNKADPTAVRSCDIVDADGSSLLHVACFGIDQSTVLSSIDPSSDATFVLSANVRNTQVISSATSSLQVSLSNFTNASVDGMASGLNHIHWTDLDAASNTGGFFWVEYHETTVRGTVYGDSANNVPLIPFSNP